MKALHPTDLLAAYALDAVTEEERVAIQAHLLDCSSCRAEVERFRSVTEVLEMSVVPDVPPSPALRDRIVQASARTPQLRPSAVPPSPRRRLAWPGRLVGWLAAAVLLAASIALGAWNWSLQQQLQALSVRPVARVALAATADAPGANGSLAIDAGRGTFLTVGNLPQLGPSQVYEVWVIDSSGPQPAGTFLTTPDGRGAIALTRPAGVGQVVAITAEPAPGTPGPTGKILLKGVADVSPAGPPG
jgi:hypothetical protein